MACKHTTQTRHKAVKVRNTWWKITIENCTKCYKQIAKNAVELSV